MTVGGRWLTVRGGAAHPPTTARDGLDIGHEGVLNGDAVMSAVRDLVFILVAKVAAARPGRVISIRGIWRTKESSSGREAD